jgi:hypothetical protein
MQRRCGWLTHGEEVKGPPVWARNDVVLFTCPKSYVTSESETLVEEFFVRRRMGAIEFSELSARQVEAFAILEKALTTEVKHGQEKRRSIA